MEAFVGQHVPLLSSRPDGLRFRRKSLVTPLYHAHRNQKSKSPHHRSIFHPTSNAATPSPPSDNGDTNDDSRNDEADQLPEFEQLFLKGPVPGDRLVRTISACGEVSCRAVNCTGLVTGAARLHRTSPVVTVAFGRALASALLLASGKKDGEQLQIEIRGSGPINGLTVIANGVGEVRGYVGNPDVSIPLKQNGQLDVSRAIGKGIVAVVRSSPMAKAPYTGLVTINSGEVAEDIANYLLESEQTPSALAAGVYVEKDGRVGGAAGFLVQLLPGASERTIEIMERNVRAIGPPTDLVRSGKTPEEVVEELMKDLNPLNVASASPRYFCKCGKDRVKRTVSLLSSSEIRDILEKEGKIEAICEFCGQVYRLEPEEVESLLQAQSRSTDSSESVDTGQ